MTDIKSPEERSWNMAAIRSKDTKPEVYLRKLLFAQGYRYRKNYKKIPGIQIFICQSIGQPFLYMGVSGTDIGGANMHMCQKAI